MLVCRIKESLPWIEASYERINNAIINNEPIGWYAKVEEVDTESDEQHNKTIDVYGDLELPFWQKENKIHVFGGVAVKALVDKQIGGIVRLKVNKKLYIHINIY